MRQNTRSNPSFTKPQGTNPQSDGSVKTSVIKMLMPARRTSHGFGLIDVIGQHALGGKEHGKSRL
jgi:hypothetical protein